MAAADAAIPAVFKPLRTIGRSTLGALRMVGGVGVFALRGVISVFTPPWFPSQLLRQLVAIGFFSLPVVGPDGDLHRRGPRPEHLYRRRAVQRRAGDAADRRPGHHA
jgi:hypothetical protein